MSAASRITWNIFPTTRSICLRSPSKSCHEVFGARHRTNWSIAPKNPGLQTSLSPREAGRALGRERAQSLLKIFAKESIATDPADRLIFVRPTRERRRAHCFGRTDRILRAFGQGSCIRERLVLNLG